MKARRVTTGALWAKSQNSDDHIGFGVDTFTSEVMQAAWRNESLCALIDSYDRCGEREQQVLCAACPISEPCFWAALIEERPFRATSTTPPGIRGGVEGTRRRFILRELTDQQLMDRYRRSVTEHNTVPGVVGEVHYAAYEREHQVQETLGSTGVLSG